MVTPRIYESYRRGGTGGGLVQLAGVLLLGVGCGIELAMKAHVGFVLITAGSVIFAIGTKLLGR